MSRQESFQFRGLVTSPNPIAAEGSRDGSVALSVFDNMWLSRPNLLQAMRPVSIIAGSTSKGIRSMWNYDGGIILIRQGNVLTKLTSDAPTTFVDFTGTFINPNLLDPTNYGNSNWKHRSCIASKNFYFTTSKGVYRVSGMSDTPVPAGNPFAPGFSPRDTGDAVLSPNGTAVLDGNQVAYTFTLAHVDAKGNHVEGVPSSRWVFQNVAAQSANFDGTTCDVKWRAILPAEATTSHYLRVYRSANVPVLDADGQTPLFPDADERLVAETQLTTTDLSNKYVEQTDIYLDDARGQYIYTAANNGSGIASAAYSPPLANEVVAGLGRMFCADTASPGVVELKMIVPPTYGDVFNVTDGYSWVALEASDDSFTTHQYTSEDNGTAAFNLFRTATNLIAAFNSDSRNLTMWAIDATLPGDLIPTIRIVRRANAVNYITAPYPNVSHNFQTEADGTVDAPSNVNAFSPAMAMGQSIASLWNLTRTSNIVSAAIGDEEAISTQDLGLFVGCQVTVGLAQAGASSFGGGPFTILSANGSVLTWAEVGANVSSPQTALVLPFTSPKTLAVQRADPTEFPAPVVQSMEIDINPARVWWSPVGQPESFPLANHVDVGDESKHVIAIVFQRGQAWVFKEDGIFRIFWDGSAFDFELMSSTYVLKARESAIAFNDKVWAFTQLGVISFSEAGFEVISGDIQQDIRDLLGGSFASRVDSDVFAIGYESEQAYFLFYPMNTASSGSAGACGKAYVFKMPPNERRTWSTRSFLNGSGKNCGLILPSDGKMYLADGRLAATANSSLYQENKTGAASDFNTEDDAHGASDGLINTMTFLLSTARHPALEKRWNEVVIELVPSGAPTNLNINFTNDYGTASSSLPLTPVANLARAWPPLEQSRGGRLIVGLVHQGGAGGSTSGEFCDIAGISIDYDLLEGKVTR